MKQLIKGIRFFSTVVILGTVEYSTIPNLVTLEGNKMIKQYKVCTVCGLELALDEFFKNKCSKDGRKSQCKVCVKKINGVYLKNNQEKTRETMKLYKENNKEMFGRWAKTRSDSGKEKTRRRSGLMAQYKEEFKEEIEASRLKRRRDRAHTPEAILKARFYYQNNKERIDKRTKDYYNKTIMEQKSRRMGWRSANKEKVVAHSLVSAAVKRGDILKPSKCTLCNSKGRIVGHHENYGKPLEVVWLCQACHLQIHNPTNTMSMLKANNVSRIGSDNI